MEESAYLVDSVDSISFIITPAPYIAINPQTLYAVAIEEDRILKKHYQSAKTKRIYTSIEQGQNSRFISLHYRISIAGQSPFIYEYNYFSSRNKSVLVQVSRSDNEKEMFPYLKTVEFLKDK